jgi:CBS domain containing-hemolysin-like protein
MLSALFSGLNLAVFSVSQLRLQIEADSGNRDAMRVLDLRKNSNQVLATIVWGNVGTNVFLTLLSDRHLQAPEHRSRAGSPLLFLRPRGADPPACGG